MNSKIAASRLSSFVGWGALVLVSAAPCAAQPQDGRLETSVRELARDVADYLKNNAKVNEVALGSFAAVDSRLASSFGMEIKRILGEELGKTIRISAPGNAKYSCLGEYRYFPNDGKVVIDAYLTEERIECARWSNELFDVSDIAALMGATGRLSVDAEKRQASLIAAITNPQPTVQSLIVGCGGIPARVAAAKEAQYAVEIGRLTRRRLDSPDPSDQDYEPVKIIDDGDGILFAALDNNDGYAIRLINNMDQLAAATITIDGLNIFTFSNVPEYRALGKVLVPPRSEAPHGVLLKGWHYTNEKSYAFQVCEVGSSAVAQVRGGGPQVEEQIGVITVLFAAAADLSKNESLPPGEPKSASFGTTKGPLVGQTYSERKVKIGLDREVISVRYSHPPSPATGGKL